MTVQIASVAAMAADGNSEEKAMVLSLIDMVERQVNAVSDAVESLSRRKVILMGLRMIAARTPTDLDDAAVEAIPRIAAFLDEHEEKLPPFFERLRQLARGAGLVSATGDEQSPWDADLYAECPDGCNCLGDAVRFLAAAA